MDDRMKELIKRLHEQTANGKVVWEKTADKATFQASFSTYAIRISSKYGLAEAVYEVSIYDKDGDVVESADTDNSWEGWEGSNSLPPETHRMVADLYARARRMALDVDQALDTLLETLASR